MYLSNSCESFFADLLDDEYYKTVELSLCEEYIKE